MGSSSWVISYVHHRLPICRSVVYTCIYLVPNSKVRVRHKSSWVGVESLRPAVTVGERRRLVPPFVSPGEVHREKWEPEWKKMNSMDLGITTSMIAEPTRYVLSALTTKGYDVYLVGGCVRDLILKRVPKDFDVLTSAQLEEVSSTFPRCQVVGKRFPICHVHVNHTIVEVSSFSTNDRKSIWNFSHFGEKPSGCDKNDYIRWKNCLRRDFTINGLMFDPNAKIIYDYLGGLEDMRKAKVRTVIPAGISFTEDCARILRAIRVAARLHFHFTKELAHSVRELSCSVSRLDKGRIFMEMNYLLAFGSAEDSLRLLWRFGLLEVLLPFQAAYFVSHGFRRCDKRSNMLLSLFSNLDRLAAPDRPCHSSLWGCILAFHKALVDRPRNHLVVAVFSLAIHGESLLEAVKIAKSISLPHVTSFHELSDCQTLDTYEALINEVMDLAESVRIALGDMTNDYLVSRAMAKYPQAPRSDLVFISLAAALRISRIFECINEGEHEGFVSKHIGGIDYQRLVSDREHEVRQLFARIVFDTVYPLTINRRNTHSVT